MLKNISPYQEILKDHHSSTLDHLVKQVFSNTQTEALILDILYEKTTPLFPFLNRDLKPWQKSSYHPSDLAFDFLAKQGRDWLNNFTHVFEKFMSERKGKHLLGSDRLKALVAQTGAGVQIATLQQLQQQLHRSLEQEFEIALLIAKIQDHLPGFDALEAARTLQVEKNPHLLPLYLFYCRKDHPFAGISLLSFDENLQVENLPESFSKNYLHPYLKTYLRQSIYSFLNEGTPEQYVKFMNLRDTLGNRDKGKARANLNLPWVIELFNEVMGHPGLETIKAECDKAWAQQQKLQQLRHQEILHKNLEE